MLPRADINITAVGRAPALAGLEGAADPRQQAFQRSLANQLGKALHGEVVSKLTDGSFIVKLGATAARMLLPPGAQVGHQVPMTLVSLNPRPTFEIASGQPGRTALAYAEAGPAPLPGGAARAVPLAYVDAGNGTPAPGVQAAPTAPAARALQPGTGAVLPGAVLLARAAIGPAEHLAALGPASSPAKLSDAAKLITSVLGSAMKSANPASMIVANSPLAAAPTVTAEKMTAALKEAIGKSGLFYESHLAEWSNGKRTLADLIREPQMQRALDARAPEAALRQQSPTDPATAQLINLQLHTQEQARVAWLGQAWPGQDMQWEIHRDSSEDQPGDEQQAPQDPIWRSALRLHFPLLGDVAARLVIVGAQVHIQIDAGSSEIGALLRTHADELSGAMEALGAPLSSLQIRAEPAAKEHPDG